MSWRTALVLSLSSCARGEKLLRLPLRWWTHDGSYRLDYSIMTRIKADGQEMDLMVDTGSEGLFFIDKDSLNKMVSYEEACESYPFGCYKSTTEACKQIEIKNSFCDGSCAHLICEEGTVEVGEEVIPNVKFGLVVNYTPVGDWPHASLGLSLTERTAGKEISFLRQLRNKGVIDSMDFSMYFSRRTPNKGELIIGGYDVVRRGRLLQKVPLNSGGNSWTIIMKRVSIGEEDIPLWQSVTIDSGSTDLCLAPDAYKKVVDALKLASSYNAKRGIMIYDSTINRWYLSSCSDTSFMPSINIVFNSPAPGVWPAEIPPKFYVEKQNTPTGGERCYIALDVDTSGMGIIGVNLLRKYYITFLYDKREIMFSGVKLNTDRYLFT